jgi:hypothetical protein
MKPYFQVYCTKHREGITVSKGNLPERVVEGFEKKHSKKGCQVERVEEFEVYET